MEVLAVIGAVVVFFVVVGVILYKFGFLEVKVEIDKE